MSPGEHPACRRGHPGRSHPLPGCHSPTVTPSHSSGWHPDMAPSRTPCGGTRHVLREHPACPCGGTQGDPTFSQGATAPGWHPGGPQGATQPVRSVAPNHGTQQDPLGEPLPVPRGHPHVPGGSPQCHSPMLECLSSRQIRASRSSFWWSAGGGSSQQTPPGTPPRTPWDTMAGGPCPRSRPWPEAPAGAHG